MADSIVKRVIRIVFDRASADQANAQLNDSLGKAGKTGGLAFLKELKAAFATKMAELKVALAQGLIDPQQFRAQADAAAKQFNDSLVAGMTKAQAAGQLTNAEFVKLSGNLKKVGDEGLSLGDKITAGAGQLVSWAAGLFAVRQVIDFLKSSFQAAEKARQSFGALATAIEDTGAPLEKVGGAADGAVDRISKFSEFLRIDLRAALARLISDTGDASGSIDHLGLVADIAAARHVDLQTATDFVAKAMEGNATALKRAGIAVDANLPLIAQLETRYHGAAEKARELDGGTSDLAKSWDELKVSVGDFLARVNGATGVLGTLSEAITGLGVAIQHPIASFKLWLGLQSGQIDAATITTLTQGQMTTAMATGAQQRLKITKDGLAAIVTAGVQAGAQQETDDAKLKKALTIAEQNLAAVRQNVIQQNADGTLSITEVGEQRLIAAESAASQARAALWTKAGADRGKQLQDAEKAFAAVESLADRERLKQLSSNERDIIELRRAFNAQILELEKDAAADRTGVVAKELADAKRLRDAATAALAASQIKPGVVTTPGTDPLTLPAPAIAPDDINAIKSNSGKGAEAFESPWMKAFAAIEKELTTIGPTVQGISEAIAEGGLAGLAKYAAAKVKQNLASALEYGAQALGFFLIGDGFDAGKAEAAAGMSLAAAAAWEGLAAGAGSLSGSSSSAATGGGGTGSGGSSSAAAGSSTQPPGADVTIVLSGPGFNALNPKVQEVVFGAQQIARERYGDNAHIRVVGRNAG